MERPEIPYALQSLAGATPTPYMIYADALLEAPPGVRPEWWMFVRLADELGVTLFDNKLASGAIKLLARLHTTPFGRWIDLPRRAIDGMLKQGGLPSGRKLADEHPHGLLLPRSEGNDFLGTERVLTATGKLNLAPSDYLKTFEQNAQRLFDEERANARRFKLIGKREMKRMNTSSSNSAALVRERDELRVPERRGRGGTRRRERRRRRGAFAVRLHRDPCSRDRRDDAAQPSRSRSAGGHAKAEGLRHAREHAGVNSNFLAGDGPDNIEALSGMSAPVGHPDRCPANRRSGDRRAAGRRPSASPRPG